MAKFTITINSILGGIAPSLYQGGEGQFATSLGIDPDFPNDIDSSGDVKTGGSISPNSVADFTGAALNSYVNWLITTVQNALLYAYTFNGRFLSYDTSFTETNIATPTSGAGNGAAYYNNYIYLATPTDIARYGPLDGTPSLTNTVWTGATLGSQTALGNATYPASYGVTYPNHPMHLHSDNKLYVGDFETANTANQGRGKIHWIKTKWVTSAGDTNDGTTQNAFYLPFNYAPIDIESWGNDLVILAIPLNASGTSATTIQGKAALFFWDAINAPSLPYKVVPLIDPFASALLNHNGDLYIWSGNLNNGVRVSKFVGGYKCQQIAFFEEGYPPPAGCVDGMGNRIVWGNHVTYPENALSVFAYGYKNANIPPALHSIAKPTATVPATTGAVTALKYFQHASFIVPRLGIAWKDGQASEDFGIDRYVASSSKIAIWRSLNYSLGKAFRINKISFSLGEPIDATTSIVPTIRFDSESSSTALTTINNTNFTASERKVTLYPEIYGTNDFSIQFRWTNTNSIAIKLPIVIEGEYLIDESRTYN